MVNGPIPTALSVVATSVPPVIDVAPVYVFSADSVSVPLPFLVSLPSPAITQETVKSVY